MVLLARRTLRTLELLEYIMGLSSDECNRIAKEAYGAASKAYIENARAP